MLFYKSFVYIKKMQKKIYIYTNERTYNMYSTHIHMDFFLNFLLDPNNRSNCRKSSSSTS